MFEEMQRTEAHRHLQRGQQLERAGRLDEAVEEYRQALAHDPHLSEAHTAMASHYQRNGLLTKAADELRILTTLEDDPVAFYNLGCTLVELGRYEEARRTFEQYLIYDPEDDNARVELAYIDYATKHYDRALEAVQGILPRFSDDWEIHNLAGSCLLRLGRYPEARISFVRALSLLTMEEARDEVLRNLTTVERYSEFRTIRSLKDRLYAEEGVIYLGSGQDNGMVVPEYPRYDFTPHDVAVTLRRLLDLAHAFRWSLSAVVAIDRAAQPMARVLAKSLRLPLREPGSLHPADYVLLVGAAVREPEFLAVATEKLPCPVLSFFLTIPWHEHPTIAPPQLLGVAAAVASPPWGEELSRLLRHGAGGAAISQLLDSATSALEQELAQLPPDPLRSRRVRYYTERHQRLDID